METPEVERELEELESRIDRLRALYEQYFMGIEKLEPLIPRKEADRRIHNLRKDQIRNTGLRFKFQMLVQRFNTMQQYWGRIVREIESGTYRRDVMRAAARVGQKEAMTIVGKKRAAMYTSLLSAQAERTGSRQGKPALDEGEELDDADLLQEDDAPDLLEDADEDTNVHRQAAAPGRGHALPVATPPPGAIPPPPASQRSAASDDDPSSGQKSGQSSGLRWGGTPASRPSSPNTGIRFAPPPGQAPPPGGPAQGAAPPAAAAQAGGVERGVETGKHRVAELAAAMKAQREKAKAAAGFGDLELNLDAPERPAAPRAQPVPRTSAAEAGARQTQFSGRARPPSTPEQPAARPASTPEQPAVRPAAPAEPASPRPAPAAARAPEPSAPARPAPAAAPDAMPDQRMRQIYAKYVETKRAANESTAGVTFEKLAATLRAQTSKIQASHPAKTVDYDVVVKDGKTTLKPILR